MPKKLIFIPILALLLTTLFLGVSFLVYITKGNPSLIRKKLKIGAILLMLQGFATGCNEETIVTCYEPAIVNLFILAENINPGSEITVDFNLINSIHGEIRFVTGTTFSFKITTNSGTSLQTGNISAADGTFDEETEEFEIVLNSELPSGIYNLSFYTQAIENITNNSSASATFNLTIIK